MPDHDVVEDCSVAMMPQPRTQQDAHMCAGTIFYIKANHSKII